MIKRDKNHLSEDIEDSSSIDGIVDINSNQSKAKVTHSGNSDVDVYTNIQIDVMPIAFAILYSLLAMKKLSNEEFELAIRRLEEFSMNRDKKPHYIKENNDESKKPDKTENEI